MCKYSNICQYSLHVLHGQFLNHHKGSLYSYLDMSTRWAVITISPVTVLFTEAEMSLLTADRSEFSMHTRAPFLLEVLEK